MREIDLNLLLYVLPPYHAYDQSPYPKRGGDPPVGMQLSKSFLFDGGV